MNTSEFSIQRFGLLIKSELQRSLKAILLLGGILLGLYLCSPITRGSLSTDAFDSYIFGICMILPFILYKHLFHPTKGVAFTLLPASQTEKFLAMFSICALIVPLGMFCFAWIVSFLGVGLYGDLDLMFDWKTVFSSDARLGFFGSDFWLMLCMQSLAVWGVCFFKTGKFWKTIVSVIGAVFALSIIAGIYGHSLIYTDRAFYIRFDEITQERIAMIFNVLFSIVAPLAFWTWGYLKLRKQQF